MKEILADIGRLRKKLHQVLNFNKFDDGKNLFEEEVYIWLTDEEDIKGIEHLLEDIVTECERIKKKIEESKFDNKNL